MNKLLSVLLAGFFAAGAYAQSSVTTKPGDAMGPTGSTQATTTNGSSASRGTPLQGDKSSRPAETTRAGEAMGPTDSATPKSHKSQSHKHASKTKRGDYINKDKNAAVTTQPGEAMGPTGTTDAARNSRK